MMAERTGSGTSRRTLLTGTGALALSGYVGVPAALARQQTPGAGTPAPGATPGTPMAEATPSASPLAGLPLNPDMQAVLEQLLAFGAPSYASVTPAQARELPLPADGVVAVLAQRGEAATPEPVAGIDHRVLPGPAPEGVLVRTYTPEGSGPFPVIVYFHGGGWVIASLDAYDASARALANAAGAIVVSVAYRQAPEHPFPAAMDDAYAATQWVLQNAAEIGGDPARVAVAGESAGGNLATVVCLRARNEGGMLPIHQLMVYPVVDNVFDTPSYQEWANAFPLNRPLMEWFWQNYLASPDQGDNPYAAPIQAQDLAGLPVATMIAAQIDPLVSEGQNYAEQLRAAGVPVEYQMYEGVTHEFFGMGAVVPQAQEAVAFAAERLQSAFSGVQ